jgi:hypothetical protein
MALSFVWGKTIFHLSHSLQCYDVASSCWPLVSVASSITRPESAQFIQARLCTLRKRAGKTMSAFPTNTVPVIDDPRSIEVVR